MRYVSSLAALLLLLADIAYAEEPDSTWSLVVDAGAIARTGQIANWAPGDALDVAYFEPVLEQEGVYLCPDCVVIVDGVSADVVRAEAIDGVIDIIQLHFVATDREAVSTLNDLTHALCEPFGGAEVYIPSPLGTPTAGQEWDPVITQEASCSSNVAGVRVNVRNEGFTTNEAGQSELTITLQHVEVELPE